MASKAERKGGSKLSLVALTLMIFTSVYGFNNIPRAFFKMGYSSIPWYIIGGLAFFLPFAFMVTELGSAFKKEKGGIYSWMEKSVGPKFAFVGTFMWYASYVIWMVSVSNVMLVPLSNMVFGYTNLPSTLIISLFGIIWIIFITFVTTKGLDKIKKFTSIGGTAVLSLNVVLILGAIIVLLINGFKPATEITLQSFTTSPNPNFVPGVVSFVAFMVYAIFAYGGVEAVGGLVDQTENAEKNFPKGVITAALIITVGYSLAIFCVGFFVNYNNGWAPLLASGELHLGNVGYVMMSNLGQSLGEVLGLSQSAATGLGSLLARFTGLSMFLAYTGAFFTLVYSPIKQLFEGTPEKLWPKGIGKLENGMPIKAMWVQCTIVVVIILINAFGGDGASLFYEILTNMTNVSMTLPYLFIAYAYYKFKTNDSIEKPFVIFKSKSVGTIATYLVFIIVGFANLFTIIQPIVEGGVDAVTLRSTISMVAGPVVFGLIAASLMNSYNKKVK